MSRREDDDTPPFVAEPVRRRPELGWSPEEPVYPVSERRTPPSDGDGTRGVGGVVLSCVVGAGAFFVLGIVLGIIVGAAAHGIWRALLLGWGIA